MRLLSLCLFILLSDCVWVYCSKACFFVGVLLLFMLCIDVCCLWLCVLLLVLGCFGLGCFGVLMVNSVVYLFWSFVFIYCLFV